MRRILACLCLVFALCGCMSTPEDKLNSLDRPVYIASIGADGDVLLRGASGRAVLFTRNYYMAQAIVEGGLKTGDVLIPLGKSK